MIRRLTPLFVLLFPWFVFPAHAQWVNLTATHLVDGSGAALNGQLCIQPVNNANRPLMAVSAGSGGGSIATRPICTPVANGYLPGKWQAGDSTAAGTNLVPDPGVTGWGTTWTNPGTGWGTSSGAGYSGTNAITVNSTVGNFSYTHSTALALVPGQTYTLAGYIDARAFSTGIVGWLVERIDLTGALATASMAAGSQGWVEVQFTVPTGVTQAYVMADTLNGTGTSGVGSFSAPLLQAGFSQLADTSTATPSNFAYRVTLQSGTGSTPSGTIWQMNPSVQPSNASANSGAQAYWCSTVSGVTTCDYDLYQPASTPLTVATTGPTGPPPNLSIGTVTTLAAGASATTSFGGSSPNYSLNLGLPEGPAGTAAAAGTSGQVQYNNGVGQLAAYSAVPVSQGGTGANTAGSAVANLGALAAVNGTAMGLGVTNPNLTGATTGCGVRSAYIVNAGSGQTNGNYLATDTVGGAQLSYVISGGLLTAVQVVNPGKSGYCYGQPPAFVIAAGGTPGTVTASLNAPNLFIDQIGDSLSDGGGGYTQMPMFFGIAQLTGLNVSSDAVWGNLSTQMAVRTGALPVSMTVSGGTIPACSALPCSGVTVTFTTNYEPVTSNGPIAGVSGTLASTPAVHGLVTLSGGVYTFTPLNIGGAVAVSSANFTADKPNYGGVPVIWPGRNDINFGTSQANFNAAVDAMMANHPPAVPPLLLGIIAQNLPAEWAGTSTYNQIVSWNSRNQALYGNCATPLSANCSYFDVQGALVNAYDPSWATDAQDHVNGAIPARLHMVTWIGTLNGGITSTTTSLAISGSSNQAAPGTAYWILIDTGSTSEEISLSGASISGSAGNYTITGALRAANGGTAFAHLNGAQVYVYDPQHVNGFAQNIVSTWVAQWVAAHVQQVLNGGARKPEQFATVYAQSLLGNNPALWQGNPVNHNQAYYPSMQAQFGPAAGAPPSWVFNNAEATGVFQIPSYPAQFYWGTCLNYANGGNYNWCAPLLSLNKSGLGNTSQPWGFIVLDGNNSQGLQWETNSGANVFKLLPPASIPTGTTTLQFPSSGGTIMTTGTAAIPGVKNPAGIIVNTGSTTANWAFSQSLAAGTFGGVNSTLDGHVRFSGCTASGQPYASCTAANTGTCTFYGGMAVAANSVVHQFWGSPGVVIPVGGGWAKAHFVMQNSALNANNFFGEYMEYNGTGFTPNSGGSFYGGNWTIHNTDTAYVNISVQNSVAGDQCFIEYTSSVVE